MMNGVGFNIMLLDLCFCMTSDDEQGGFETNAPDSLHFHNALLLNRMMSRGRLTA